MPFQNCFYRILHGDGGVHLTCRIIVKKSRKKLFCKTTTIIQDKPNGKTFVIQNANEIQQKTLNPLPDEKVLHLFLNWLQT